MNDFSNLGEQIKNTVQEAVDTMNFDQLNKNISDSVRSALDDVRSSLNIPMNNTRNNMNNRNNNNVNRGRNPYMNQKYQNQSNLDWKVGNNGTYRTQEEMWEQRKRAAINRANEMRRNRANQVTRTRQNNAYQVTKASYTRYPGQFAGPLLCGFGYPMTAGFGIASAAVLFANTMYFSTALDVLSIVFPGIFALSLVPTIIGHKIIKRNSRYRLYMTNIGKRKYITFTELALATGYSEKYLLNDIRKMMQIGMFPQAHLDAQGTCLILDDETYKQYLEANASFEQRRVTDEAKTKENKEANVELDAKTKEELDKTITEGKNFIRQITEANDAIPAEDISQKLYRMEEITSKIFDFVEDHPEQLPELRKFMEYYLPISLKLVNAYQELDRQPIQGENITKSKQEIVKTLDTINYAFENLLDSLYQSTAMEVSSDISVLEALFAQDGLTHNNDFDMKK